MVHESVTTLPAPEIFERAKAFFADRVPHNAAYPEKEGATFLTLRGQGGEEIAIATFPVDGGQRVRASTLLFDQVVLRFLATLPKTRS